MSVVFVSSTWQDLVPERTALDKALHDLRRDQLLDIKPVGSGPDTPAERSMVVIDDCDVFILILARSFGIGITESSYRRARQNNIPCLIYFRDDSVPVLPRHIEQDSRKRVQLELFKQELLENHPVATFSTPEQLAQQVSVDLGKLLSELKLTQALTNSPNIYVRGDLIVGDKTGGDKFTVDNIADSNLAIGQSSSVSVGKGESIKGHDQESGSQNQEIVELHQQLVEQFSVEELQTLSFQLGFDYEEIGGNGKSAKARELIIFMQRRKQLDRLKIAVKQLRG